MEVLLRYKDLKVFTVEGDRIGIFQHVMNDEQVNFLRRVAGQFYFALVIRGNNEEFNFKS